MRRLPVLAALTAAALIAASAWLVIDARSDPQPLPSGEHLPRDDQQSQQQDAQDEPEPSPDDAPEQDSAEQLEDSDEVPASEEEPGPSADEDDTETAEDETDEPAESEQAEESAVISDEDLPEHRLIKAIDLDRRQPAEPVRAEIEYEVEIGDTLALIADAHGVDIFELALANGIDPEGIIRVGDVLRIPSALVHVPLETPPGPDAYSGGGLIWGTITDAQPEVVHTAVVYFIDHRAGLAGAPDLIIGCINNRLVVELSWTPPESNGPSDEVRLYWRVNQGPLRTSLWTVGDGVLSATGPKQFIDSLRGALDLRLYPAAPDAPYRFYWYPSAGVMVESPVQANIDNCGR